ncbi:MAG: phosphoribosylglycinamide formyltransferase [Cryomorphaceae bacterium]|nr:phosphoribosylglycinamide formyltransferase [Cryomorphaceae bacterium]
MPKKLAIFASGSGSNAENICNYFAESSDIKVVLICTNREDAFIVKRANKLNIPVYIFTKYELNNFVDLHKKLQSIGVDIVILAGFLLKLPAIMVDSYPNRIINIHPSLLPKYGGKGMYGSNIHKAVIKNKETESGISIHFVNQNYDEGKIILQKKCSISASESVETLIHKIHKLEHNYFPGAIEKTIKKL